MIGNTLIDEHVRKATQLSDAEAWIEAHTEQLKKDLLDLIRINQLREQGINEFEQIIGTYSFVTQLLSGGRKQAGDPFTLEDTGDFYRSMYVNVLNDSIIINADYEKMQDQTWWSESILGLTEENLGKYAEMVKENYVQYVRKTLGLD